MTDAPLFLAAGSALDARPAMLLDVAAAAGFDGVGLRLSGEHRLDRAGAEQVRAAAAERGLVIHDAEVHRIGDPDVDPGPLIERAAAVGAATLLIVSDMADQAETARRLSDVAERCRAAGLQPAIEYMAWTTPADPVSAVELAGAAGCTLVVDLLHHARLGAGAEALAAIVASGMLGWVQLCDAPAELVGSNGAPTPDDLIDEARHHRLPPGEGGLPIAAMLDAVPADTPISVEVQSDHLAAVMSPDARAERLYRAARRALDHRRS